LTRDGDRAAKEYACGVLLLTPILAFVSWQLVDSFLTALVMGYCGASAPRGRADNAVGRWTAHKEAHRHLTIAPSLSAIGESHARRDPDGFSLGAHS
jgi:hypothetical protein